MSLPTPFSLVISPEFGAVHWDTQTGGFLHNERGGLILRDESLAGRNLVFNPVAGYIEPRTTFEMGRHTSCWLKIGWVKDRFTKEWREVTDNSGYPLMNYFPRITLTFQWMDAAHWSWVEESAWYVVPGGMFVNKAGVRERSGANLDVYLNNVLIKSHDNNEPLFQKGDERTCIAIINRDIHHSFDVPYEGKIIALDYELDKYTTSWPSSVWTGELWPTLPPPAGQRPLAESMAKNTDLELATPDSKRKEHDGPWYSVDMDQVWAWYSQKGTLTQMILITLISTNAALLIWVWKR